MRRDKFNMIEELKEKDEELTDTLSLLGMTALTQPGYVNSMRALMFTSQIKQTVNLVDPEPPAVFTSCENVVGKYSSGYKKTKKSLTVYKTIYKYADMIDKPLFGWVFLVNETERKFSVVERKEVENLTENYGFIYRNEVIDGLHEGDKVPKNTVLYRSRSYDETMNYSYGINVPYMYVLDAQTTEDAAVISESLAKRLRSSSVRTVKIPLNDNHYLINLYGTEKDYKPLPGIGEYVRNGVVAAKRTLINNQVLNDFKTSSLQRANAASDGFCYGSGRVIDVSIYCNNEDLHRNSFNSQLIDYYEAETKYYQEIVDTCEQIFKTGYSVTPALKHLYKRAKIYLNTDYKWKEGEGVFSNMQIEITLLELKDAAIGQKITGRYGNKSVISEIRPDYLMPHRDDGKRIDLLLNELAIINRTTSAPLFENSITFICERVQQILKTLDTLQKRADMVFEIIDMFNEDEARKMKAVYNSLTDKKKEDFIAGCVEDRIYIHQQPLNEGTPIFFRLIKIYEKYAGILKPYDIYVYKFGRWIKTEQPAYVGDQYIMKLKQTGEKGFSARNTGEVNMEGLPEKSHAHKNATAETSENTVRFGEFETYEFKVGMSSSDIARFFAMYRSSVKGRRDLAESLLHDEGTFKFDKTYTSRVNEIFGVLLKSLGIGIEFNDSSRTLDEYDDTEIREFHRDKETYLDTEWGFYGINLKKDIEKDLMGKLGVVDENEFNEQVEKIYNQMLSCFE